MSVPAVDPEDPRNPFPPAWALGKCFCCQRTYLVRPLLTFDEGLGPTTLPICTRCRDRARRLIQRNALRAQLYRGEETQ